MAFLLIFLLAVSVALGGQDEYNFPCDLTPAQHDSILEKVVTILQEGDLTVTKGLMNFSYHTSFHANPSSPYGTYSFADKLPFWHLDETDAVVFFGCTPPPVKYFSLRSYVIGTFHDLLPIILLASLGDSTNQLVINTTSGPTEEPFGKTTVVTTTADIGTDQTVRNAFITAGVPATSMNTDIIPSSLVKMGLEPLKDTFAMLYRVAVFENPEEVHAYLNFTWPVLYIHPPSHQSPQPFATPALRKRGTGKTEASYNASLLKLVKEVVETVQSTGRYSYTQEHMSPIYLEGWTCIKEHTNCVGDNRDAGYMNSTTAYTFEGKGDPSFFIVCGLNHVKTGKATYTNFAVGSAVAVDDSKYGESAKQYAPEMPDVDMFYAYKVARQCNGESYCLEVSTDKIKEHESFPFIARAYLEPPTRVGPVDAELLLPYVLYFTPL